MTIAFNHTDLFGGAITVSLPVNFVDVSKIRQVPDNQEVYLDKNGFTSLTFDITERVSHLSTDKEALEYHFADTVAETDTPDIRSLVENVELPNFLSTTPILALTAITKPSALTVAQALAPAHTVIHFTLIRLVEQSTDIVVTLNIPCAADHADSQALIGTAESTTHSESEQEVRTMYYQILTSFAIQDWGLFSSE